jgi:hypothetical protein
MVTEMESARIEFRTLVESATPAGLTRPSSGTRWTNGELLFHMLLGYLVARNLRPLLIVVARLPEPMQGGFARSLNFGTTPFDLVNYWGSRLGARLLGRERMIRWFDRIVDTLQVHVRTDSDETLGLSMGFPARWDPYFADRMTLADLYHYPTLHFEHHRRQLTLDPGAV